MHAHIHPHTHTDTDTHVYVHAHYMTNADWGQLYSPVVACRAGADLLHLCGCLAAAFTEAISETMLHTSLKEANNTIYTNLARGGGNFQLMGNFFFTPLVLTASFQNGHPSGGLMRRTPGF